MPLYEYRCAECGKRFEILQRLGQGAEGLPHLRGLQTREAVLDLRQRRWNIPGQLVRRRLQPRRLLLSALDQGAPGGRRDNSELVETTSI